MNLFESNNAQEHIFQRNSYTGIIKMFALSSSCKLYVKSEGAILINLVIYIWKAVYFSHE